MLSTTLCLRRSAITSARVSSLPSMLVSIAYAVPYSSSFPIPTFPQVFRVLSNLPTHSNKVPIKNSDISDSPIVIPSNLRLDPRSLASPWKRATIDQKLDLKKVPKLSPEQSATSSSSSTHEDAVASVEKDISSLPLMENPQYVIPLPQRLHIPIYHFTSALEQVGTFHLSPKVFGLDPIREDILHRCVVYQRNKKRGFRNPGARTKTISEVSGSGRKVRNQKGGGVARAGHRRPPHWRGGAKAHGPKGSIQNYTTKLNKKVRRLGILMALSQKLKEGNMIVVNGFDSLENHKTKSLAKALDKLGNIAGRDGSTAYLIDHVAEDYKKNQTAQDVITQVDGVDVNLRVASSNLFKVKVSNQRNVNVYDILKHEKLVLSLNAVQALESRLVNNDDD